MVNVTFISIKEKYNLIKEDFQEVDEEAEVVITVNEPTIEYYKPIKGCVIDELWAKHMNKANLELDVKRI